MSSLQERLARFDRSPRPNVVVRRRADRDLSWAHAIGLSLCGQGESAHLVRRVPLGELAGLDAASWHRLSGEQLLPARPWAILDTETTGLESGTGTLVFVTAVLRVESDSACLIQRFLIEPAGEASFLRAFCEDIGDAQAFLSYNGKSFDLPRLRARLRMHRMPDACLERPHLDLLHVCRRLTSGWLADARLSSIERHLLGIERHDDVPGAEVPAIYRQWLQTGASDRLDRVLLHNRLDVENLHALSQRLSQLVSQPRDCNVPAAVGLAIGRLLEQRGRIAEAEACYQSVLESSPPSLTPRIVLRLARLARRRGDYEHAANLWHSIAGEALEGILARIELAKLYEHKRRDFAAASQQTRAALAALSATSTRGNELGARLQERLSRLSRKLPSRLEESP